MPRRKQKRVCISLGSDERLIVRNEQVRRPRVGHACLVRTNGESAAGKLVETTAGMACVLDDE